MRDTEVVIVNRKEIAGLPSIKTSYGNPLNVKIELFLGEVNIECGIGGGDDC